MFLKHCCWLILLLIFPSHRKGHLHLQLLWLEEDTYEKRKLSSLLLLQPHKVWVGYRILWLDWKMHRVNNWSLFLSRYSHCDCSHTSENSSSRACAYFLAQNWLFCLVQIFFLFLPLYYFQLTGLNISKTFWFLNDLFFSRRRARPSYPWDIANISFISFSHCMMLGNHTLSDYLLQPQAFLITISRTESLFCKSIYTFGS